MAVGEKIKYYRQQKGISQKVLGEAIGVGEGQIRKYELGIRNPKYDKLQQIAEALGVAVSLLLDMNCRGCQHEEGYAARHQYPCNACLRNTELFGDNYKAKQAENEFEPLTGETKPVGSSIGEKIRFYRKKRGLTQKALAEKSGLHIVSIKKYETNRMQPQLPQIKKLAVALEVELTCLVEL